MSSPDPVKYRDNKRQFHSLLKRATDIKQYRTKIDSLIAQSDDGSGQKTRSLEQLAELANSVVVTERHYIQEMLRRVDQVIASRKQLQSTDRTIPQVDDVRAELQNFFAAPPPVLQGPYPPLCGAVPLPPDQVIPTRSFVCIQHDADYILGFVLWFDPEACEYHVCDADPMGDVLTELVVPAGGVIPLPVSCPARRSKATMHPVNARVLALWPDEPTGTWTSVFYPASVLTQPMSSPGWYHLQFDGDEPYFADIPEKYLVLAPPDAPPPPEAQEAPEPLEPVEPPEPPEPGGPEPEV
jgi:hypothetical protein